MTRMVRVASETIDIMRSLAFVDSIEVEVGLTWFVSHIVSGMWGVGLWG